MHVHAVNETCPGNADVFWDCRQAIPTTFLQSGHLPKGLHALQLREQCTMFTHACTPSR